MTQDRFRKIRCSKRRGESPPARLRVSARRGVTLVELMISMLILAIVCVAWLQIIGIQSARREARRREAVERLSGIMDAFMYCYQNEPPKRLKEGCSYMLDASNGQFKQATGANANLVRSVFDREFDADASPVGYRICVEGIDAFPDRNLFEGWELPLKGEKRSPLWLVGRLYDRSGCQLADAGNPFFTLRVCLGF